MPAPVPAPAAAPVPVTVSVSVPVSQRGGRARLRWCAALLAACLVLALGACQSTGRPVAQTDPTAALDCPLPVDPLTLGTPWTARCERASPQRVRDGRPITVTVPGGAPFTVGAEPWGARARARMDPTWQLEVYGLTWLPPLVRRARQDGQQEVVRRLLDVVPRFTAQNPDHGGIDRGWDEGTALRRLESLVCLYVQTKDARLIPAMDADAAVLLGPRYYGPPNHRVHNHGLMANVRLIAAGRLIGRPAWVQKASERIRAEAPHAFSEIGLTYEQSTAYQIINTNMWADAGRMLREFVPDDPVVADVRELVTRAQGAAAWVTEPDGGIVQIGDARRRPGVASPCPTSPRRILRDDAAGYGIGRWSQTDPATTYYSLRYGPARRAHGHRDQGSVTWSAGGRRIVVGTGFFGYDAADPRVAYGSSPAAANTAVPRGGGSGQGYRVTALRDDGDVHTWTLDGTPYGTGQRRTVAVDAARRTLTATDELSDGVTPMEQRWHLDPQWRLERAGPIALTLRAGADRLHVRVQGGTARVVRGSNRPLGGWVFPEPGKAVSAAEIVVSGRPGVRTTFTLDAG